MQVPPVNDGGDDLPLFPWHCVCHVTIGPVNCVKALHQSLKQTQVALTLHGSVRLPKLPRTIKPLKAILIIYWKSSSWSVPLKNFG